MTPKERENEQYEQFDHFTVNYKLFSLMGTLLKKPSTIHTIHKTVKK